MGRRMPSGPTGWQAAIALVALALLAWVPTTTAAGPPGGNNGTVKIHEGATEVEPIVANDPHVCTFHLHFFFADPSQSGDWEIQAWSPGHKGNTVLSGTYDTTGDGEDRVPDSGAFSLPDGHYKLFWEGRSDHNVKHKVFWVECGPVPQSASPSASPSQSPRSSPSASASASPTGSELPAESERSTPSGGVLPAAATPPATDALPATSGGSGVPLVLLGLAAVAGMAFALTPRGVLRRR